MSGDMETLRRNTRILLERLIGTWDFMLVNSQYSDPVHCQYVMREIHETRRDVVMFGYDKTDDQKFNLMFSPTIEGFNLMFSPAVRCEYLFSMKVMKTEETYVYFFNQKADCISGEFGVCSTPELAYNTERDISDILIASGTFVGLRRPEIT